MIQSILHQPWVFLAWILVLVLLQMGAALRIRHDRKLRRRRALADRRQVPRPEPDRRWSARPRHK
ncbi:MAG TPA: hypothetical protein VJ576_12210 [Rhodocyclaceae bacterium]|nr:hypothetical protein [Rhodocyclaceae bacterium]